MDETVRLWHMSSNSCLRTFARSDYVTFIQFNPVDDSYFISGSLDEKVRLWSIPDCQVVEWNDLHEMVTAACYTPDGKGAVVGSHKRSCHLYDTSGFRNTSSQISASFTANGKHVIYGEGKRRVSCRSRVMQAVVLSIIFELMSNLCFSHQCGARMLKC